MALTPEELDALTKDELLEVAAEMDVTVASGATKAQIRDAIDSATFDTAVAQEPSEARKAFLAGEMSWRDYVAAETAT